MSFLRGSSNTIFVLFGNGDGDKEEETIWMGIGTAKVMSYQFRS